MVPPSAALLFFGFLLGMRHALEPDHLAAVSTLVANRRSRRPTAASFVGAAWGLGHTLALFGLGGVLMLLRVELPADAEAALETAVAAMLVALGAAGLRRAYLLGRADGAPHAHVGGLVHGHAGARQHIHLGPFAIGVRPLLVGIIHGLAGTGALTSLVMATLPSWKFAIAYLLTFGLGSLAGMAAVTLAAGLAMGRLEAVLGRAWLGFATSAGSLAYGLYWGVRSLLGVA